MKMNNILVGWSVYDVVRLHQTWCMICARERWHESYNGKTVCTACCDVTPEVSVMSQKVNELKEYGIIKLRPVAEEPTNVKRFII